VFVVTVSTTGEQVFNK